jgi:hypothetical protein
MFRAIAAKLTRANTTVNGGSAVKAILLKKKDPPHNIDKRMSKNHATESIDLFGISTST